ncbi:MAG: 23S rRNA (pseudouridine(1915)-N(3))-methyltransferase RlmH, partial [Eubacteriales bacterium]|nr:23S rRNA (pseudouridine(1915)-N(3))-methyltransferase RlmH [Eubacteriales bacterium]
MAFTIVCVGKARERFYADAVAEYVKRMSALTPCEVIEVPDEPEPKSLSDAAIEQVKKREGERILAKIPAQAHVTAMCIDGREWTSEAFSAHLSELMTRGQSRLCFVIGGSLGLHECVLARADERLSMGRFTMPHQLARVVLA